MNPPKPQQSDQDIHFRPAHQSQTRDQGKIDNIVHDVSLAFSAALQGIVKNKSRRD